MPAWSEDYEIQQPSRCEKTGWVQVRDNSVAFVKAALS